MANGAWVPHRRAVHISVFGSFEPVNRDRLDAMIARLRNIGYEQTRRLGDEGPGPPRPSDTDLARLCEAEASTVAVAVFVLFAGDGDPNQSTIQELHARLANLEAETGVAPSAENTLVLRERGVPARAVLRGNLARAHMGTPDEWENQDDLNTLAAAFLLSLHP